MVARIWLIGVALIVVTLAGVGLTIDDMRGRTIDKSRHEMATLGAVLAEQTSRYAQVIDLLIQDVQTFGLAVGSGTPDSFRARLSGAEAHEFLKAHLKNLPQAHSIALIGADGSLISWSRDIDPRGYSFIDRDYFRHFREVADHGIFVGAPAKGYASGVWSVFLTRRVSGPNDEFLGVVSVAVNVRYLLDFYRTISRDALLSVTLNRSDGVVLARFPDTQATLGGPIPTSAPWYRLVAENGGTYRSPGHLGELPAIVSVTPLRDYPLVVDVSIKEDDALAIWRRQAVFMAIVELAVTIAFIALFGAITRQVRRQTTQHADLRRATEALRLSKDRLRDFAQTASDWFWEQDAELRFTMVGDESPVRTAKQLDIGKTRWELNDTSQTPALWAQHVSDVKAHKPFSDFRYARIGQDGKLHHISVSGLPVHDESGRFLGYRGTGRDITRQVEFELQLQAAKDRAEAADALLRDAIDSVHVGCVIYDRDDRLIMCNGIYRETFSRSFAAGVDLLIPGTRYVDILRQAYASTIATAGPRPSEAEWIAARLARHREDRDPVEQQLSDGSWFLVTDRRMKNGGIAGIRIDITALKRTSAALIESEARLDRAQEIAGIGSWELDIASGRYTWSRQMYRMRGLSPDSIQPNIDNVSPYVDPDDYKMVRGWLADLTAGVERPTIETRIVRPDGVTRVIRAEGRAVRDPDGAIRRLAGTMQDITERREIEQQLIQAQKMEAIGNLTGGMAHDFNNLLGVISGNLFLLAEAVQGDAEQEELCRDALEAANRGAELTRRLLAFGRRQSLRPQATDINLLVAETTKLLTRVLGEDVSVELRLAKALRPTVVDPAQLEAAITNLVNNARDAMPKGGRLTIATSAAHLDANDAAVHPDAVPGDYNIIEVTDTGTGMPPEIKARIFDPFFTTKPQGKGTGLGLSMVFGFVRQSNGHVSVRSEPGHGTTVRLYLPYRVDSSVPIAVAPQREIVGGDEAILLVEDDVAMRRIAAKQLAELGYAVTEAETPAAALEMLDRGAVFDLLLTDVVMPGEMDGLDLATAAQRRWGLKTLLMSGFPEARFAQRAEGEIRPRLISKPFQRNLLAAVLRELLDAPPQAEAPRRPAVFAAAD